MVSEVTWLRWPGAQSLFLMWLVIEDHDNLFIMAEFVHFAGIGMLLYKLFSKKNAGGNCKKICCVYDQCS